MPTQTHPNPKLTESDSSKADSEAIAEEAKQASQELAAEAKQQAIAAKQRLVEKGQGAAQQQKDNAAQECEIFGSAIREAAAKLDEEGHEQVACYAEACADELDRAGNYIRDRDFNGLYQDASEFARKRPEVFLGGMFLAGVALARLMKASTEEARQRQFADSQELSPEFGPSATADPVNPYTKISPTTPGTDPTQNVGSAADLSN